MQWGTARSCGPYLRRRGGRASLTKDERAGTGRYCVGKKKKGNAVCDVNSLSFYPHTRTVTPQYLPPSITDSVTSHCITLILIGQYAARVTLKTEHNCAETEPELPNLLVRVLTPCAPASSHLARPRLHLHNGRRRPARQEQSRPRLANT